MTASWCHWDKDTLILTLRVQPRASRDEFVGVQGNRLKVRLAAAPADGRANERLVRLLAREFRVARSAISLLQGDHAREKRLAVRAPKVLPVWIAWPKGETDDAKR